MKKIVLKKSHNSEKTEREDPLGFCNIHSVEGGPFGGKNFGKKSHSAEKSKEDPLVSSGFVYYAGNLFGSVHWANRYNLASSQNFVELW